MDFESISLATRTQCLDLGGARQLQGHVDYKSINTAVKRDGERDKAEARRQKPPLGIEPRTFSLQD